MTSPRPPLPITAVIIAFNEEIHIRRCIERLWPLVERIVVIDSFSTDRTVEICRELGAEVLQNPFKSHAAQFQWGLDNARVQSPWTLRVDADEYLEPELIDSLFRDLHQIPDTVTSLEFRRKVYFKGKFLRWGGYYSARMIRLWRTGLGEMEQAWMDERIVMAHGECLRYEKGDLVDENLRDIHWWTEKHNGYATKHMVEFVNRRYNLFEIDQRIETETNNSGSFKRFLRNKVYDKIPFYVRPIFYFHYVYFLRLGFLDGKRGFIWHFLQGFWYRILIDVKIEEALKFIQENGTDAFRDKVTNELGFTNLAPTVE